MRAARREPVERTPVWFMRQAGRSLPEYREVRRGRTLFDVVRDPELCAEVTLQPVRRHDVDAAVMFADIMLPVLGMGVDVELVENVGPVVQQPIASAADVERLRIGEPDASILEAIGIVRRELRDDQAVDRLLRRRLHGRGLPRRGKAEPRLHQGQDADVPGAAGVARALRQARRHVRHLRAREGRRRRRRRAALRLVGRRALGRRLRRVRRAVLRAHPRERSTCRRSTSAPGPRTCCARCPMRAAT